MSAWRDKEEFKARVLEWADKLEVKVRVLTVRPMRNKWASCSTAGNLNFSTRSFSSFWIQLLVIIVNGNRWHLPDA